MSLNIETDRSLDHDDPERFCVVERKRHGWSVLFRGTREACQDYAQQEVEDRNWNRANR